METILQKSVLMPLIDMDTSPSKTHFAIKLFSLFRQSHMPQQAAMIQQKQAFRELSNRKDGLFYRHFSSQFPS